MVENCLVVELALCRILTRFGMIIWKAFLHCECFSFLSPDPFVILKSYPTLQTNNTSYQHPHCPNTRMSNT